MVPSGRIKEDLLHLLPPSPEAFGAKWGFVAVFMPWVKNLPFFPAVLAFAASDVAYNNGQLRGIARHHNCLILLVPEVGLEPTRPQGPGAFESTYTHHNYRYLFLPLYNIGISKKLFIMMGYLP